MREREGPSAPVLSDRVFAMMSRFIQDTWGLKMPSAKRIMLQSRLGKRLRVLGLDSFEEYCEYLFGPEGRENEVVHMTDAIMTNKTEFFREPQAFDHLVQHVLPGMVTRRGAGVHAPFKVWSAGCSTGEEPYTLAMLLAEFARRYPGIRFDYLVLATDISSTVLETARRAVYGEDRVGAIPSEYRRRYLMRTKERSLRQVRVVPELREKVSFRRLNLMEDFGFRERMDVIFCRNVIIYFDRQTQETLMQRLCSQLKPDGYLFTGHSESLNGMALPLERVVPMVYRRTAP